MTCAAKLGRRLFSRLHCGRKPGKTASGKLKIFFSYASGTGKTYAMLKAAHAAKMAGADVVVGYVNPNTHPATLALLDGLEQIDPVNVHEHQLNLAAALKRRPEIILADELARDGAGTSCRKRYQDVKNLLKAGIDVYTTVNIHHIESLSRIVASITGEAVRESIPDSLFETADQLEMVDTEPAELLERFSAGKIRFSDQAQFYTMNQLAALRGIALQWTVGHVGQTEIRLGASNVSDSTKEHILVCLSASPSNARVISAAARMADAFRGRFTALFVQTPGMSRLSEKKLRFLRDNLRLAEHLGARTITVYGEDAPAQIAEFARVSGITKIIIGNSYGKRRCCRPRSSLAEQMVTLAPYCEVYMIPDNAPYAGSRGWKFFNARLSWKDTWISSGIMLAVSLLSVVFFDFASSDANIITFYILGVLFVSILTGNWIYSAAASLASVLLFNYLFTEPYFTFQLNDPGYYITFAVMFTASFITSTLTVRTRNQARQAAMNAYRTGVLLETSQKLQQAETEPKAFEAMACQIYRLLGKTVILYPVQKKALSSPVVYAGASELPAPHYTADGEQAAAAWAAKNIGHAGATTYTMPEAKCLYMSVRSKDIVFAVTGVAMDDGVPLDLFDRNILVAMLDEFALALDKMRASQSEKQVAILMEQEQLRTNLMRAISHDLRTPLTSISGNAGILISDSAALDEAKKQRLYSDIYDDAMWLINLVENLLFVTRIENGTMNLRLEPELLDEIIQEAMLHLNRKSADHQISVSLEDDMLMARMDSRLIVQVIINIVNNAVKYTPEGSHIWIVAQRDGDMIRVDISDDGDGIPDSAKPHLFEMFYTGDKRGGDGRRGLGLGLPLCKAILTAHGGSISVTDRIPHGAFFSFTLKAEEVNYAG